LIYSRCHAAPRSHLALIGTTERASTRQMIAFDFARHPRFVAGVKDP
jgi:hypothetical protein